MKLIFNTKNSYKSDKWFKSDLQKINELNQKNVEDLTPKEISRLIYLHERSALCLRRILEETEKECDIDYFQKGGFKKQQTNKSTDNDYTFFGNLPVKIEKKEEIYHIFTPYTFKRGMAESFQLSTYLRAAIAKEKEEGMIFESKGKSLIVVLRVANQTVRKRYRDNDNLETSEMINVIFSETFLKSDNVLNMSFFSDYLVSDDSNIQGFHLFVLPYSSKKIKGEELLETFYDKAK